MSITSDVRDSRARRAGYRRPELLDRIPPGFASSPGVYAAAGGLILIYGLGLAVALPGIKASLRPQPVQVAQVHDAPARSPTQEAPPPSGPEVPPPPAAAALSTPNAPPKAADTDTDPRPKVERTTQVANVAPIPVPPPAPPEPPKVEPKPPMDAKALGKLIDPTGKAQLSVESQGLTIKVPGKLCLLFPPLNVLTAPRALADVDGDFDVQVKVVGDSKGDIKPNDPVPKAPVAANGMPIAFSGAGLLIWQDEGSFIRLERGVGTQNGRNFLAQVLLEVWKGGQMVDGAGLDLPAAMAPLSLRIQRRGGDLVCSYSPDGQAWVEVKKAALDFNPRVQVGVLGSNTSKKPLIAGFEEFMITPK